MDDYLFSIECVTCQRRLAVRDSSIIGDIVTCPKCGSMVQVLPPEGWFPPDNLPEATPRQPATTPPSGQTQQVEEDSFSPPELANQGAGRKASPAEISRLSEHVPGMSPVGEVGTKGKKLLRATPLPDRPAPPPPPPASPPPPPPLPRAPSKAAPASLEVHLTTPPAGPLPTPSAQPEDEAENTPTDFEALTPGGGGLGGARWLTALVVPLLTIVAGVGIWALLSLPKESEHADNAVENAVVSPPDSPSPAQPLATAVQDGLDVRWLPNQTRGIACLRLAALSERAEWEPVAAYLDPFWRRSIGRLLNAFRLLPRNVRRLTWASTDLAAWDERTVVVIELEEDQDAGVLSGSGEPLGWDFSGKPCRRLSQDWLQPYVVLNPRTVITGPEDLLRELSGRTEAAFHSGVIEQLVTSASPEAEVNLLVDLDAAREAGWPLPTAVWDIWPAGRASWRVVWETPKGLGLAIRTSPRYQLELALVCDSESSAIKVREALGQFVPAARAGLDALAAGVGQRLAEGQLTGREAAQYEGLLQQGAAVLAAAKWDIVEQTVILRVQGGQNPLDAAMAAVLCTPRMRDDWLAAALAADLAHQARLVTSLAGYARGERQFPTGAAGGSLLPAETRLSWIATMLPYLDRRDWHRELQFGYSWNSPQNRPVTQRPLEPVTNPALGPARTDAGFPVTHYVGVAGVGTDAAELKTGDPRAGLFGTSRVVRPEDLPRGASNTLATLGVSRQLGPWAAGGNATVRALTTRPYVNGPDGFGSGQPHGMVAGMADGSARFLSKNIDPQVLEELAVLGSRDALAAASVVDPRPATAEMGPQTRAKAAAGGKNPSSPQAAATPSAGLSVPADKAQAQPSMVEEDELDGPPDGAELDADPASKLDLAARLAVRIPEIQFPAVPLLDAVRLISQMSTVPVSFDLDWFQTLGVGIRDPVTVRLTNATVGEVFAALAANRNLACEVLDDQVLLTAPAERRNSLRPRKFDVSDLIDRDTASGSRLAEWTRKLVSPESWREAGGPGTVQFADAALAVTQNDRVHAQVQDFLDRLRLVRGKSVRSRPEVSAALGSTRFDLARAKLRQTIRINIPDPTPLVVIVRELERLSHVTILFDGVAMSAAGVSRSRETTLALYDRPLSEALVSLLDPLGLTYRMVNADTFEITTRQAAAARLELEIYPLASILAKPMTPDSIMERIKNQVASATWNDAGGPGVMIFDETSRALLVLQSQPVQVKVQLLLAKL